MEQIIPIVTVLLILSLITEKITGFIRANFWHLREFWNRPAKHFGWKKIFLPPSDPKEKAKNLEKQVSLLSLVVGFIVAFFSNASMFSLLQISSLPSHKFYLDNLNGPFDIGYWGGCLLSSFFLSFGSKFFHDLLDLILQTKNLKRKLNEPETYEFDKVAQLDNMLSYTPSDYAQLAFDKYESQLLQIPNVSWISMAPDHESPNQKYLVKIHLKDGNTQNIPKILHVQLPNNIDYPVATEVIPNCGEIKAHFEKIKPGTRIGDDDVSENGSLGCFIKDKDNQTYFITCYHVVQSYRADKFDIRNEENIQVNIVDRLQANLYIGDLVYGEINESIDIALVRFYEERDYEINVLRSTNILKIKEKKDPISNKDKGIEISFQGSTSGCSMGKIVDINVSLSDIKFNTCNRNMKGVIVLQNGNEAISKQGDSGSVIIDKDGNAIGMIFAGDDHHSFAIPMEIIINKLQKLGSFTIL